MPQNIAIECPRSNLVTGLTLTPICSQNASSLPICSPNANSLQICSQNASSLPIAGLQPKRQFAARTPIRCPFAAQTPISRFNAFLQPKRISAAQTHVSHHRLCPCSCSAKRIERNYWGCKAMSTAHRMLSRQQALRSLRGRNPFASLQTGPTVCSGTRIACFPDSRPCGVFGD